MKLIFVNRYFYPDNSATAQLLSDLAFGLAGRGANVLVITNRQRFDNVDAGLPAHETVHGVQIERVWTSRFGRAPLSARMVDYLSFYLFASLALVVHASRGDIIVAKTDPPLISVPIALIAFLCGARLVNWAQDVYPEVAERKQVPVARGALGAILRALRNLSLRAAVVNVVLGERMARETRKHAGARARIEVVHNWADGDAIAPIAPAANPLRPAWDLAGKFVVEYSGNMGQVHEFKTILDAAQRLSDRPEIVFLLIGSGFYRVWIEEEVRARKLANVLFKPYQPREQLSESLGIADMHLISLLPAMEGLVVPSKIYGIMACGRPTLNIGDPAGEVAEILVSAKAGFTVPPGDAEAMAGRILEIASSPGLGSELGANARRAFERRFSHRIAHEHWVRILLGIDSKAFG